MFGSEQFEIEDGGVFHDLVQAFFGIMLYSIAIGLSVGAWALIITALKAVL